MSKKPNRKARRADKAKKRILPLASKSIEFTKTLERDSEAPEQEPQEDQEPQEKPESKELRAAAFAFYKAPFRFDALGGFIWDADGNMVSDDKDEKLRSFIQRVRGWGRISKLAHAEALQDQVGELIAEALNRLWAAEAGVNDEEQAKSGPKPTGSHSSVKRRLAAEARYLRSRAEKAQERIEVLESALRGVVPMHSSNCSLTPDCDVCDCWVADVDIALKGSSETDDEKAAKAEAHPERFGTHYDSLCYHEATGAYAHATNSCQDPERCDCECPHCIEVWEKAGKPGSLKELNL